MFVNLKTSLVIIIGLLFPLGLSACGAKTAEWEIELNEFEFSPNTFEVEAGAPINLHLNNTGALEHNFVILKAGYEANTPFDANNKDVIYYEMKIPAKETSNATFTAPSEPGVYEVICSIPGHLEQHMKGTLTVTAKE